MKKFNIFFTIISATFTLTCIYLAFTQPRINVFSISLFIFVGIGSTYLHASNLKQGEQ